MLETTTREYTMDDLAELTRHNDINACPPEQRRLRVLDLCCGPGGVGVTLHELMRPPKFQDRDYFCGVDTTDYGELYPGEFQQADLRDITLDDFDRSEQIDLVWASPPCLAYTPLSYIHHEDPKAVHPTIPELEVREVCQRLGKHYVIENVVTCDDLLDHRTVSLNGPPFYLPIHYPRAFEVSFHEQFQSPTYTGSPPPADELVPTATANREVLANAKGLPQAWTAEWSEQEVRSAIPPTYVSFILSHCPTLPEIEPPGGYEDYYRVAGAPAQRTLSVYDD